MITSHHFLSPPATCSYFSWWLVLLFQRQELQFTRNETVFYHLLPSLAKKLPFLPHCSLFSCPPITLDNSLVTELLRTLSKLLHVYLMSNCVIEAIPRDWAVFWMWRKALSWVLGQWMQGSQTSKQPPDQHGRRVQSTKKHQEWC